MRKLRIFAALAALCIGFTACSKIDQGVSENESSTSVHEEADEGAESKSEEQSQNKIMNPLTGEYGYNEDAVGKRPAAVMVSNIKAALPQYGIDEADIIYEIPVEGGITRLMAVYADYTNMPNICSVRSCRYYYPKIAYGMDAFYCHWGSDKTIAMDTLNSLGIDRLDGNEASLGYGNVFQRDQQRAQSYSTEHTSYLKGSEVPEAIEDLGYRTDINDTNKDGAFRFNAPDSPEKPEGEECLTAKLNFSSAYFSTFEYDDEKEIYKKYHSGNPHVDGVTGNQLGFKNVLALGTSVSVRSDGKLMDIGLDGGDGYYISQGAAEKISWKKESDGDPIKIYDDSGEEIKFNAGKTYIGLIKESSIEIE